MAPYWTPVDPKIENDVPRAKCESSNRGLVVKFSTAIPSRRVPGHIHQTGHASPNGVCALQARDIEDLDHAITPTQVSLTATPGRVS